MEAKFVNHSTNKETVIELRGDFWGGSGDLTVEGGPTVAQITRQMANMREVLTDKQTVSDSLKTVLLQVSKLIWVVLCHLCTGRRPRSDGCHLYLFR